MRKQPAYVLAVLTFGLFSTCSALAHFLVLLPSRDTVADSESNAITFNIEFTHPMEQGPVMNMERPVRFGVITAAMTNDLLGALMPREVNGATSYVANYDVQKPGDHVFFIEPAPYWEPFEARMIVHYTKVVVDAFGAGDGWDTMVGFPVEIEPLVSPYGLWAGNIFRGIVRNQGAPVPFAHIEVEYFNENSAVSIPSDAHITQVIKANASGEFAYAMPRAGWWGFAALIESDETMTNPQGQRVPVEQGGLIWVKCVEMK